MAPGIIAALVLAPIGGIILGLILGIYFALKYFKKQMKENPPITEDQIRAMYAQMGRKPSEGQIKQVMNSFKHQAK
jgi:uncharacterized protein YneF (UPF0154 family)